MGKNLIDNVISIERLLEDIGGDFTPDSVVKVENEQIQNIMDGHVNIPGTGLLAYVIQVVAGGVNFCMTLPVLGNANTPYTVDGNAFFANQNLWKAKVIGMPVSLAGIHAPFNEKGWHELIYVRALAGIPLDDYVRQTLERFKAHIK